NNITGNSYTGDVTLYKAGEYLATTTVSGTISEGTSLEGSFAGAGIGNGSFSVSYDSVVNAKTAGLSEIAGTRYRGPVNASITDQRFDIDAAGNIISSFASTNAIKMAGCEYVAGSSLTAIAGQNLYDLVLVLSSCDDTTVDGSYTGLATLIDDPVLSLDNRYMPAAFSNGSFAGTASPFTLN
ncbi:MAG: hypothetical protein GY779_14590, partial [Gammaproteobacteria bacterium]|nr:hypothetical protein [Gammaproteobacteria bacterium]